MNKVKYLIYVFVLTLGLASCEKELDIPSEASLNAEANLSEQDVDRLLNGLYKKMRHPNGYGFFAIMNTEIMGDNYKPVKFQWFQVQNFYEHKVPASDILLSYLRLYDMFERLPLVDENYDKKPIAPSAKEKVLEFIIEDLKFAKENCKEFDKKELVNSQKTPSKEAAIALLARVYRIAGDIQAAGKEAELLLSGGKFSLSANPLNRSSEVIFMFIGTKAEEVGSWGWIMSPQAKAWNCFAAADDLTALVQGDDTRKILFDFENKDKNDGYVYSKKYKTEDNSDLLVSRIAEMYLLSAEAGNNARLKELQTARKSSLSLEDERRLEMSFEWTRWQDLKLKGETYVLPYPERAAESNPLLK